MILIVVASFTLLLTKYNNKNGISVMYWWSKKIGILR